MAGADEYKIREYLLGRLSEAEEEQVELRLLTDPDFAEEYDIVVNELVDNYIAGKFEGENLKQVEDYFFRSPERRNKLRFTLALKQRKADMVTTSGHKERPTEARLSDFSYAPLANQRGGPTKIDYVQRDRAASLLLNAVTEHPSAVSHDALGKY